MRTLLALSLSGLILGGVALAPAAAEEKEVVEQPPRGADPFGGGGDADPFGGGDNLLGERGADPFGEPPAEDPFGAEPPPRERPVPHVDPQPPVVKPRREAQIKLDPLPQGVGQAGPAKVEDHLRRRVTIWLEDEPLEEVTGQLAKLTGQQFYIDRSPLDEIGLGSDSPANLQINHGMPLGTALKFMVREIDPDLTYYVRDNVVVFTTRDAAAHKLQRYLFDVTDLLPVAQPPIVRHVWRERTTSSIDEPAGKLIDLIQATVEPAMWEEVGGPWSIRPNQGVLLVSAGPTGVDRKITDLLAQLRKSKSWDGRDQELLNHMTEQFASPWQALDVAASLDMDEQPLEEVVEWLGKQHKVEVYIDRLALQEIGLSADSPCNIQIDNLPLKVGLELLLRDIDPLLVLRASDGVFIITTSNFDDRYLESRVFPIRDLAASEDEVEQLIELLQGSIEADTWDEVGGYGGIAYFAPAAALVVSQTPEVHKQIHGTLAEMREKLAARPTQRPAANTTTPPPAQPDEAASADELKFDQQWPIVVYHVALEKPWRQVVADGKTQTISGEQYSLEALPALVERLIGKQHWEGEHATIELLGGQLIIRQTPAVHRRIEELLRRLEVLQASFSGDFGKRVPPVVGAAGRNPVMFGF